MRQRFVTLSAESDLQDISAWIGADNPDAAARYYRAALDRFAEYPDDISTPKRASDFLPDFVHEIAVPGFRGYTLRIAFLPDALYLLCAFRPGLTGEMKDDRTRPSLKEL